VEIGAKSLAVKHFLTHYEHSSSSSRRLPSEHSPCKSSTSRIVYYMTIERDLWVKKGEKQFIYFCFETKS